MLIKTLYLLEVDIPHVIKSLVLTRETCRTGITNGNKSPILTREAYRADITNVNQSPMTETCCPVINLDLGRQS